MSPAGQCGFGLANPGHGGGLRGHGAIQLLLPLIQDLLGGKPLRYQEAGSLQLLLRQAKLRLLLRQVRLRLVQRFPCLQHHRRRLAQRGLQVLGIHHRDNLAWLDHVALVGQQFGDTAGEFGGDIDLVGFEAAVAEGDPGRQSLARLQPPVTPRRSPPSSRITRSRMGFNLSRCFCGAGVGARGR